MSKRSTPEEIIAKLREVEFASRERDDGSGRASDQGDRTDLLPRQRRRVACRLADRRMKEIEKENARLRKAISDHAGQPDPSEVIKGKF
ncbi:MAG: hypothetical protein R3B94_09370 [Hyphomonas sp.]